MQEVEQHHILHLVLLDLLCLCITKGITVSNTLCLSVLAFDAFLAEKL